MSILETYLLATCLGFVAHYTYGEQTIPSLGLWETIYIIIGIFMALRQISIWEWGWGLICSTLWALLANLWLALEWENVRKKRLHPGAFVALTISIGGFSKYVLK